MGTTKTRAIFIDVARKLFAEKGIENTTMHDIALEAHKGRRTLYTYFKSKDDIYYAVIESELFQLAHKLQNEMQKNMNPPEKLMNYIYVRMDIFHEAVMRNGNLRASFFRNIHIVEKSRHRLDITEMKMLESILLEGNQMGYFNVKNPKLAAMLIQCSLKGCEVPFIRGDLRPFSHPENRKHISSFILSGLAKQLEIKDKI
ncbi:MAG: TetR/AcrR family transcriptional regulator [Paludibacteraceae bacterium]|nr:TetR/AcrR family transcriptional regulator [Paludibacteraceae bacterium]